MKQKRLYVMCGPSGSGKSTWVNNYIAQLNEPAVHVSRDVIRFSLVGNTEEYFSKEDEVFDTFCKTIQKYLNDSETVHVFADATHLSPKARNAVLDRLKLDGVELIAVVMKTSLKQCWSQNDQRTGRANVPHSVIRRMHTSFVPPSEHGEKYNYTIINVGG